MKIINFLLAVVARWAVRILALPLYLTGLIITKDRAKYNKNIAISYDQLGNVLGGPLFNVILKKKGGHEFGNPDETISFVLGENKKSKTLTNFGLWIADKLNEIDPDHVENAKS